MQIQSFEQAKIRLKELSDGIKEMRDFLDMADDAISAVNTLKGGTSKRPARPANGEKAPASMTDRVLQLFQEANKPLMPKEALTLYATKGWPRPEDDRQFYLKISRSEEHTSELQ